MSRRYTLKALENKTCHLTVVYDIVYLRKMNIIARGVLERGARGELANILHHERRL